MLWIVGYSVLAAGSLVVLGLLALRVLEAVKQLGRVVEASQGRIDQLLPTLEAAFAHADDDRHGAGHRTGWHG